MTDEVMNDDMNTFSIGSSPAKNDSFGIRTQGSSKLHTPSPANFSAMRAPNPL